MPHASALEEQQPLRKPFLGSVAFHAAVIAALLLNWTLHSKVAEFGQPEESSGSVGINTVKTIPIPSREGRVNRLANDTQSIVPPPPPQKKEVVKAPPPDPRAIPIPSRTAPKRPAPEQASRSIYKPETVRPNQLSSQTAPALKSPNFDMQGNGGVGLGPNTTLGTRFGYYVDLMRQRIANKWSTAGMANDGRRVLVTFAIQRDGSVEGVRVAQTSGNYALDSSAQRAVLEAAPLPPLPPGYEKSSAQVELWFQVR